MAFLCFGPLLGGVITLLSLTPAIPLLPHQLKRFSLLCALIAHECVRVRGGPCGVCIHCCACSSERASDSAVPCSQPAPPSRCCEDDVLPSWRGRTRWFFFPLSLSVSRWCLDAALGCHPHHRDLQRSLKGRLSLLSWQPPPFDAKQFNAVSWDLTPCNLWISLC